MLLEKIVTFGHFYLESICILISKERRKKSPHALCDSTRCTHEAKVILTQRYPQSSDTKETAKIAKGEQEADLVLRQTARPFYFPFVCERVRRKTLLSCSNSYPRSCLRLVLYTISQSLMKSLTTGSSVMHIYALDALH